MQELPQFPSREVKPLDMPCAWARGGQLEALSLKDGFCAKGNRPGLDLACARQLPKVHRVVAAASHGIHVTHGIDAQIGGAAQWGALDLSLIHI